MRPLLFLPLLVWGVLCLGGAAHAQQQESRIENILKPDRNQSFNLMQAKSFGSKSYERKADTNFQLNSVSTPQKFNATQFLTGKFNNGKSFWGGDFKYSADKPVATSRFLSWLPTKIFGSKSVAVKSANVGKTYETGILATRDYRGPESRKFGTHLTSEQAANAYDGQITQLKSIDDVRNLLNKSK